MMISHALTTRNKGAIGARDKTHATQNKELLDTRDKMHAARNKEAQGQKSAQDKMHATVLKGTDFPSRVLFL